MKKTLILILLPLFLILGIMPSVEAHCPLCTAAIGAAAVSAKYYGMDTTIIGLLIGAFGISTGLWVGKKIKKEYLKFQLPLIVLLSFLLTIIPLMSVSADSLYMPVLLFGSAGSLLNKVYWVNKILLGGIVGGIVTLTAFWLHLYIKKVKGGVLFPFQGIMITLVFLILSGLGLYLTMG